MEILKENDTRSGLGMHGMRVPSDKDMNFMMGEQTFEYWYNLDKPIEEYPTDNVKNKYRPNFYPDMLEINGYMSAADVNKIMNKIPKSFAYKENNRINTQSLDFKFTNEAIIKAELGGVQEYKNLGNTSRAYESRWKNYDENGEYKTDIYKLSQHVYLYIWTNHTLPEYEYRAKLSYNPNRFVLEQPYVQFEPVLYFAEHEIMPHMHLPWIHRLDLNCDLMVADNAEKLELIATDKDDNGKPIDHRDVLWSDHDSRYYKDHSGVMVVRYNKSLEKLNNKKTSQYSYINKQELIKVNKHFDSEVVRLELRLTEYGLKHALKLSKNIRGHHKKTNNKFLPTWLKVRYAFIKDGKRKQHGFKEILEAEGRKSPAILESLPLVTKEMLLATQRYDNKRNGYSLTEKIE